ncbi:MAG: c-type cytochrome [Thiotrichaceae bacterium]|nr:c-type cytochrome [Thiotrichaceae bacterium]
MSSFIKKAPLALGMALLISQSAFAADDKKEKPELLTGASTDMIVNTCAGCHGPDGYSRGPAIPTIGGMAKTYIVETMEGFKSEEIPSTIMGRIAKGYTTEEFEQMGDYFSAKPYVEAKGQESDKKLAAKGKKLHKKYCEKCHSEGGTEAEDEAGMLTGQWKAYTAASLTDYISGDRKAPKKMKKKLKKMIKKKGKESVEALIEYYAK